MVSPLAVVREVAAADAHGLIDAVAAAVAEGPEGGGANELEGRGEIGVEGGDPRIVLVVAGGWLGRLLVVACFVRVCVGRRRGDEIMCV